MGRRLSDQMVALLTSVVATDGLPLSCRASPNRCVGRMNALSDTGAASHGNRYGSLFPSGRAGNSRLTAVRCAVLHPSQRLYSPSTHPLPQMRKCCLWGASRPLRGSSSRLACDLPDDTSISAGRASRRFARGRGHVLRPSGPSTSQVRKEGSTMTPLDGRPSSCRSSSGPLGGSSCTLLHRLQSSLSSSRALLHALFLLLIR
ncbi:hypothetical protein C8Q73DRAFT_224271 [Cubamyces lactineus]|nr:hypothetical protein C8Q73DRAFT_224271 [Cubamyces lactineus]